MDGINNALKGLGTRDGVQADGDGVGTTIGDWVMRFKPILPWF
jgi:hypothetical protein